MCTETRRLSLVMSALLLMLGCAVAPPSPSDSPPGPTILTVRTNVPGAHLNPGQRIRFTGPIETTAGVTIYVLEPVPPLPSRPPVLVHEWRGPTVAVQSGSNPGEFIIPVYVVTGNNQHPNPGFQHTMMRMEVTSDDPLEVNIYGETHDTGGGAHGGDVHMGP